MRRDPIALHAKDISWGTRADPRATAYPSDVSKVFSHFLWLPSPLWSGLGADFADNCSGNGEAWISPHGQRVVSYTGREERGTVLAMEGNSALEDNDRRGWDW